MNQTRPSLLADFAAAVERHPERVAIVDGRGVGTSFAALAARATALARGWAGKGIGRGDRVLLAMPLGADLYASLAALWSLGAVVVLPEPAMGLAGVRHAALVARPVAFCSSGLYRLLHALPELWGLRGLRLRGAEGGALGLPAPSDRDIALISFTSGTTGAPKAIPRSHGFMAAQRRAIAPLLHSPQAERDLVAFPVFVLINLAAGQTSVLPNWRMSRLAGLKPAALSGWIAAQGVTRALIPPALCEKLEAVPPCLHAIFTGGGPVFPDMLDRLTAHPGLGVMCVYGSTEAEPIAHLAAHEITAEDRLGMIGGRGLLVGHPVPGLRVRIVADEVQVAGEHVNTGYLDPRQDEAAKVREGAAVWHRTGDAGHLDAQGRLWIMGRVGSAVGGVYPFQVEVAARGWPGVMACALVEAGGAACLVIAGDAAHTPAWADLARAIGIARVEHIAALPMDRRHASKVDRRALARLLGR